MNHNSNISTESLLAMAERYFNATLNESEELLLKQGLTNNDDPRLNEIKAVMGFCAYGKKHRSVKRIHRHGALWQCAAGACIAALIATASLSIFHESQSSAIAYIAGEKITDGDEVMQQMLSTMHSVDINHNDAAVENELHEIFNTIN